MDIIRRERQGVPFYACTGFDPAVVAHGFSTRLGGVSTGVLDSMNLGANRGDTAENVELNFRRFCSAVGTDAMALVKNHQIHGELVRPVTLADKMDSPNSPGVVEADGLITDVTGLCLTVFSADCIPVLLFDPVKKVVAAVHAGWRGTALGIAARAAEQMVGDYGSSAGDILAAIGPGISKCCFETHRDVPDGLRSRLGREADDFIAPLPDGKKFMVDIKGVNGRWLEKTGLSSDHIAISSACTACDLDTFWSHRILGGARGSMAAMIQIL